MQSKDYEYSFLQYAVQTIISSISLNASHFGCELALWTNTFFSYFSSESSNDFAMNMKIIDLSTIFHENSNDKLFLNNFNLSLKNIFCEISCNFRLSTSFPSTMVEFSAKNQLSSHNLVLLRFLVRKNQQNHRDFTEKNPFETNS